MVHSKRCQAEESPYLQSILIETVVFYTVGQVSKRAWLSVKILNYMVMFSKCFSTHQLLLQMLAAHVLTGMQLFPTCAFPLGTLVSVHKHCLLVSSAVFAILSIKYAVLRNDWQGWSLLCLVRPEGGKTALDNSFLLSSFMLVKIFSSSLGGWRV